MCICASVHLCLPLLHRSCSRYLSQISPFSFLNPVDFSSQKHVINCLLFSSLLHLSSWGLLTVIGVFVRVLESNFMDSADSCQRELFVSLHFSFCRAWSWVFFSIAADGWDILPSWRASWPTLSQPALETKWPTELKSENTSPHRFHKLKVAFSFLPHSSHWRACHSVCKEYMVCGNIKPK